MICCIGATGIILQRRISSGDELWRVKGVLGRWHLNDVKLKGSSKPACSDKCELYLCQNRKVPVHRTRVSHNAYYAAQPSNLATRGTIFGCNRHGRSVLVQDAYLPTRVRVINLSQLRSFGYAHHLPFTSSNCVQPLLYFTHLALARGFHPECLSQSR